jgi:hypothetical protein
MEKRASSGEINEERDGFRLVLSVDIEGRGDESAGGLRRQTGFSKAERPVLVSSDFLQAEDDK